MTSTTLAARVAPAIPAPRTVINCGGPCDPEKRTPCRDCIAEERAENLHRVQQQDRRAW